MTTPVTPQMSKKLSTKSNKFQDEEIIRGRPPTAREIKIKERASAARLAAENRRGEFKQYVNNSGIMESLTKVLLSLYEEEEKPKDALEYLYNNLTGIPLSLNQKNLEDEKADLEAQVGQLEGENQRLLQRLEFYESGNEVPEDYLGEAGEQETQGE